MASQVMTIVGEAVFLGEVALGAVILLLWCAIEAIGFGGWLLQIALNQRWIVLQRPVKPARDIKWGTAVRAAGFRGRRVRTQVPA
jgi:hypothetical protein